MRVLVVHASQFGSTAGIAEWIGAGLRERGIEATVAPATEAPAPDEFDAAVVGSAVHGGHWLTPAMAFVHRHRAALETRPVWLFSSGPLGARAVTSPQPDPHEIGELREAVRPVDHRVFAGSFDRETADFSDLGLLERTVVRRFLPDGDWRDWNAIDAWTAEIARTLERSPAASR